MDCTKLRSDIARLETLRGKLEQKYEILNDNTSKEGVLETKDEAVKVVDEIAGLEDQILESYLLEFKEHNPGICEWELGKRIGVFEFGNIDSATALSDDTLMVGAYYGDGLVIEYRLDNNEEWHHESTVGKFENFYGRYARIHSVLSLSNNEILIGGTGGALYICQKNEDGEWEIEERIAGFKDYNETECDVNCAIPLEDEKVIIGGEGGALYICQKSENGKWELGERITPYGYTVRAIVALSNNRVLVGGKYGVLWEEKERADGEWDGNDRIEWPGDSVNAMTMLPDGRIMIGGDDGIICIYKQGEDGAIELEYEIEGFVGVDGPSNINSITLLPDGSGVMIGGTDKALYVCRKDRDGKWRLGDWIEGFGTGPGRKTDITSVVSSRNGKMLVCGDGGNVFEANTILTLDVLKRNLNKVGGGQ